MSTYTTVSGDTWDIIAYKVYGSGNEILADKIMTANRQSIDYFIFPAGVVLTIPELEQEDIDGLPPWMTEG